MGNPERKLTVHRMCAPVSLRALVVVLWLASFAAGAFLDESGGTTSKPAPNESQPTRHLESTRLREHPHREGRKRVLEGEGEGEEGQEGQEDNDQGEQNEDQNGEEGQNDNNNNNNNNNNNGEEANNEEENNAEGEEENNGEEEKEQGDDQDEGDEEAGPEIDFLKCAAFTVEPKLVDTQSMLQSGAISESAAAALEASSITKMTPKLNTQESVVFFTYGYGADDQDRKLYMAGIDDWVAASYGYGQICHAIDQDDVDYVFSRIPSVFSVHRYSSHTWYAGFNCRSDGTGFQPRLFLDATCTTFSTTMNEYYPFGSDTGEDQANQDYTTQVASDQTKYMVQNIQDTLEYAQYCEESDFCDTVLGSSVEVTTCGGNGDDDAANGRNLAESGNAYQIEYGASSSIQNACPSIKASMGLGEDYDYTSYQLEWLAVLWSNTENGRQAPDRSRYPSRWVYPAACLLAGAVSVAALFLLVSRARAKKNWNKAGCSGSESDDSSGKKEPLVGNHNRRHHRSDSSEDSTDLSAIECRYSERKRRTRRDGRRTSRSRSGSRRLRCPRAGTEFGSDAQRIV